MFYYRSRWNPTAHMFSRDDRGERKPELQILELIISLSGPLPPIWNLWRRDGD